MSSAVAYLYRQRVLMHFFLLSLTLARGPAILSKAYCLPSLAARTSPAEDRNQASRYANRRTSEKERERNVSAAVAIGADDCSLTHRSGPQSLLS